MFNGHGHVASQPAGESNILLTKSHCSTVSLPPCLPSHYYWMGRHEGMGRLAGSFSKYDPCPQTGADTEGPWNVPPCLTDMRAGHVDAASQQGNRRVGSRSRLPTEWELAPIEEAQGACAHHWLPSWLIKLSIRSIRTRATRYPPFPASRTLTTPVLARPISPSIPNSGIRARSDLEPRSRPEMAGARCRIRGECCTHRTCRLEAPRSKFGWNHRGLYTSWGNRRSTMIFMISKTRIPGDQSMDVHQSQAQPSPHILITVSSCLVLPLTPVLTSSILPRSNVPFPLLSSFFLNILPVSG